MQYYFQHFKDKNYFLVQVSEPNVIYFFGEITLCACNELLLSACYVGLCLTFINVRIFWFFLLL